MRAIRLIALAAIPSVLLTAACGQPACDAGLSAQDTAAARAVVEAYRTAWLRGDAQGVMDTFTPDAVLLPAHGAPWVVGTAAIKQYWWPPNAPPTSITRLDITTDSLQGDCRTAWVYGHDDVEWTTSQNNVTTKSGHPGTYLNVLTKQPDGAWKISRHMWDDGSAPK